MNNISLFKNFTKEVGQRTLTQIVDGIRGDHYRQSVLKIRALIQSGHKGKANQLKKELVAFTVSGLFEGGRKMPFLKTYNPFVILDIDKLDPGELPGLILKIKQTDFTRVCFISPSGRGLKIIVEVDSEMENHKAAYWQVMNYYKDYLMVEIDKSGSDITRLCFMSYDPEVYFNPESSVYKILKSEVDTKKKPTASPGLVPHRAPAILEDTPNLKGGYTNAFATCVGRTDTEMVFEVGNRNNYIYKLGAFCCRAGIPLRIAIEESKKIFDFDNEEMGRALKSAYSWKPYQTETTTAELSKNASQFIPDKVFDNLPDLLKKACEPWKCKEERDIFFTGALGILSGMFSEVKGLYDGKYCYPNFFVFVIAPAGSGKNVLKFSKCLGEAYHDELLEKSNEQTADYKKALLTYKKEKSKYMNGEEVVQPEEPKGKINKTLFIPANSSSAMFLKHLKDNEAGGILFETDSDTLTKILKRNRGSHSYILRKAICHEPILWSRKTRGFVEIKKPKLSVVLSGTLTQAKRLFLSRADELFCSFLFYDFKMNPVWRDVSNSDRSQNVSGFYKDLSKEILEMVNFLKAHPTEFELKDTQFEKLNEFFRKKIKEVNQNLGIEATQIVRGMGLSCFRIAMILSVFRKFYQRSKSTKLVCMDHDFEAALLLSETYLKNAITLYDLFPKGEKSIFEYNKIRG